MSVEIMIATAASNEASVKGRAVAPPLDDPATARVGGRSGDTELVRGLVNACDAPAEPGDQLEVTASPASDIEAVAVAMTEQRANSAADRLGKRARKLLVVPVGEPLVARDSGHAMSLGGPDNGTAKGGQLEQAHPV